MSEGSSSCKYDRTDDDYTITWCLTKLYRLTIGSCFRVPFRLCRQYVCCKNIASDDEHELSDVASDIDDIDETTPLQSEDKWSRKARIEKADSRIKEKLRHQFQDHIHKWVHYKRPRFPWKIVLHLLLVGFVTAQVSYGRCLTWPDPLFTFVDRQSSILNMFQ